MFSNLRRPRATPSSPAASSRRGARRLKMTLTLTGHRLCSAPFQTRFIVRGRAILEPNMPLVPSVRHVGSEFDVPGARVLGDGAGCEQTVVRESTSEARHRSPAFSFLR